MRSNRTSVLVLVMCLLVVAGRCEADDAAALRRALRQASISLNKIKRMTERRRAAQGVRIGPLEIIVESETRDELASDQYYTKFRIGMLLKRVSICQAHLDDVKGAIETLEGSRTSPNDASTVAVHEISMAQVRIGNTEAVMLQTELDISSV